MKFDYHLILKRLLGEEPLYSYFYEELLSYVLGGTLNYDLSSLDFGDLAHGHLCFSFGEDKTVHCIKKDSQYQVEIQEGDFYSKRVCYQKTNENEDQDQGSFPLEDAPEKNVYCVTKKVEENFLDSKGGLQKIKEQTLVQFLSEDPDFYREMSYTRTVTGYDAQVCQMSEILSSEDEPFPYILPDLQDRVQITRTDFSPQRDLVNLLVNDKTMEILISKQQERISGLQERMASFAPRYFIKL